MSKSQLENDTKSTLRQGIASVVSVKVPKWAIMPIFFANERSSGRLFSESGRYQENWTHNEWNWDLFIGSLRREEGRG